MLINKPRLETLFDRENLDGLIVGTPENVMYLTGIAGTKGSFVLITRDTMEEPFLVANTGALDQMLDGFPIIKGTVGYGAFFRQALEGIELTETEQLLYRVTVEAPSAANSAEAIAVALERMGLVGKRVGFDEESQSQGFTDRLQEHAKAEYVPVSSSVRWVRMVKSDEEVRRLRKSANVVERGLTAIEGVIRPGITEYEIAREFERSVVSQGARPAFTLVRVGRNSASGMVSPGNTKLERGDTVWFDLGVTYQGYWADIARVFSLGEPSQRMRDYNQAMLAGEDAAFQAAKQGMLTRDLFALTVQAVKDAGVPNYRRHHVGHGIGLEVYDPPVVTPDCDTQLENGMVLCIETPYYEFGFGAAHIEDPLVIREGGNEFLTDFPRKLHIID
jgi:Xaa-Pro dipeptidase